MDRPELPPILQAPLALPVLLAAALSGCRSAPPPAAPPSPPALLQPARSDLGWDAAPGPPPPAGSDPVYRNPKIGIVHLRAHEDAQGRLLGPQVMYQVTDPGGWNLESLDPGHRAAIPEANADRPPEDAAPSPVPARALASPPADSPLLDPALAERITITGLMRPEDRAAAEERARAEPGTGAVFDSEAGWLLVPIP